MYKLKNLLQNKSLLLFDFDGTIANTEWIQWMSFNEALKPFGVEISDKYFKTRLMSLHTEEICLRLMKDYNIDFDIDTFYNKKRPLLLNLFKQENLQPFPYFNEILNEYKNNRRFAILSSGYTERINAMLDIWKLSNVFDTILSVSDTKISKKEFLSSTQKYLKESPQNIVYFEDANTNLALGKEFGITTVGIEHDFNIGKIDKVNADFIIDCKSYPKINKNHERII